MSKLYNDRYNQLWISIWYLLASIDDIDTADLITIYYNHLYDAAELMRVLFNCSCS